MMNAMNKNYITLEACKTEAVVSYFLIPCCGTLHPFALRFPLLEIQSNY